jgi:hypothetical protein
MPDGHSTLAERTFSAPFVEAIRDAPEALIGCFPRPWMRALSAADRA